MYVMDVFENPITDFNIPWVIRNDINREGWELVDISYKSIGTPDGECDTDVWEITLVAREVGVVDFVTYFYKDFSCLALPAEKEVITMAEWLDKGIKLVFKNYDEGEFTMSKEEVDIDKKLIRDALGKTKMEVA